MESVNGPASTEPMKCDGCGCRRFEVRHEPARGLWFWHRDERMVVECQKCLRRTYHPVGSIRPRQAAFG